METIVKSIPNQFNEIDKKVLKDYFSPLGFQVKLSKKENHCELWHNKDFLTTIHKQVDKYSKRLVNSVSQRISNGYIKLEKGTLITLNSTDTYYEILVEGEDVYIRKDRLNWNTILEDVIQYVLILEGIRTIIFKRNGNWLMI